MKSYQQGFTLWFTGLPCAGKTSLSDAVERELRVAGHRVEHLDGDVIRKELSLDLTFSKEDRATNIQRAAFIASLLSRNGVATLVSFVSPYSQMRQAARERIENFMEVYVLCPMNVCEKRDVKGMYKLARAGKIKDFTGISDPYEEPVNPEIIVDTDTADIETCVKQILDYLKDRNFINPKKSVKYTGI